LKKATGAIVHALGGVGVPHHAGRVARDYFERGALPAVLERVGDDLIQCDLQHRHIQREGLGHV
jgi:hypothetical protein